MGYRVAVLDKKEKLNAPVCCTGIVSRECVETFSIDESLIYNWANSAGLYSPAGRLLRVQRDIPQVAILNRSALNEAWSKRAQEKGAEYILGSEVRNIEIGKNGVAMALYSRGVTHRLRTRGVVVATGFGSRLVDGLGLGAATDFVMGTQTEVETRGIAEIEVYFGSKVAPSFFAWLVPTAPGKALVGLLSRRHPPAYLRSLLSRLAAESKIVMQNADFTYGGVPLKPLPRTYGDRLLVVGTAAGQVKPLTGGGIYFGLLCADIAANTLNRALTTDDLSADKLAGYERSWKKKLRRELRTGYWARRFYEILNDSQVDRGFGLMQSSGLLEELQAAEELSFDWHADVLMRMFSQKLFFKAFESVKLPFSLSQRLQKE